MKVWEDEVTVMIGKRWCFASNGVCEKEILRNISFLALVAK